MRLARMVTTQSVVPSVLAQAPIMCGGCGKPFRIPEVVGAGVSDGPAARGSRSGAGYRREPSGPPRGRARCPRSDGPARVWHNG
ncbi:hypothetical protein SVIOM342S_05621 [Streptomyces violaceorubidus]